MTGFSLKCKLAGLQSLKQDKQPSNTVVHKYVVYDQVQDAMLQGMWSREVLALPNCGAAGGANNDILWYGPRVRMGMYEGEPTRIVPHTTSGRADYFGPLLNRCCSTVLCVPSCGSVAQICIVDLRSLQ